MRGGFAGGADGRRWLRQRGLAFDRGWGPALGLSLDQMMKKFRTDTVVEQTKNFPTVRAKFLGPSKMFPFGRPSENFPSVRKFRLRILQM